MINESPKLFAGLYLVATPIGNLEDITLRALRILKSVDLIAVEDTRHSRHLLTHLGIQKPLLALHEHNERQASQILKEKIQQGQAIALITDAGTPGISDPGALLVNVLRKEYLPIIPLPGACALITALSVSGIKETGFYFHGFLPTKRIERKTLLETLKSQIMTLIFYETPHRILHALQDMMIVFGEHHQILLARELTKMFETIRFDEISHLLEWAKNDKNQQKGEFVLIVPADRSAKSQTSELHILEILLAELPLKQAVTLTQKITKSAKNDLYAQALKLKKSTSKTS